MSHDIGQFKCDTW